MSRIPILFVVWSIGSFSLSADTPTVHLEIVQQARGSIDGPQRWLQKLQRLPLASVRVRGPRPGDKPRVQQRGSRERPTFHVVAFLTPRNELKVPGAIFRQGDIERLSKWLEDLRPDGSPEESRGAFDLTTRELAKLRSDLSSPFRGSTIDVKARSVVAQIQQRVPLSVVIDPSARALISRAGAVEDEYQGLAEGTVLAATLRAVGLAVIPERNQRGTITLRIVAAKTTRETWPVGWPSEQRNHRLVPKLFDFLPVEIVGTPLSRALDAIQPRVGVPMLIDRDGLARQQIDMDAIKVRYPSGKTFYKKLLDRILFQARLEMIVRVDDADRVFLWIQTIRR